MKQLKEITLTEVSELVGVSEKQINKNFKRYMPKLEKYNILFEGKGKDRKFYILEDTSKSNEQFAYEIFEQIAYNVWGFDRQTNIDKLLHYMSIILYIKDNKSTLTYLRIEDFARIVGVTKTVINRYREKLIKNNIIMPNELSKTITIVSKLKTEIPTITSELIPNINNKFNRINQDPKRDNFNYFIKLVAGDTIKQEANDFAIVPNELYESYLRECKRVANTKNIAKSSDREATEKLIKEGKLAFTITKYDKYIAIQDFKRELGIDKLYQRHKTEYTLRFLRDKEMLDILVKAFNYKFPNDKLNMKLEKYNIY